MPANHAIIQGLYDAFARGDVPAVLGAMSPDIVWNEAEHFPYDDNPYRGPDAGDSVIALGRTYQCRKAAGLS